MKYYKLTLRYDGTENGLTYEYYDDLGKLADDCFHYGSEGFPAVDNAEEITKQEYEENHLPF